MCAGEVQSFSPAVVVSTVVFHNESVYLYHQLLRFHGLVWFGDMCDFVAVDAPYFRYISDPVMTDAGNSRRYTVD